MVENVDGFLGIFVKFVAEIDSCMRDDFDSILTILGKLIAKISPTNVEDF